MNEENIDKTRCLVIADRRIKTQEISAHTGLAKPQITEIIHNHLHFTKLSARWIPKILTAENKQLRVETSDGLRHLYNEDPQKVLDSCITEDETWVHHYDPESKHGCMMWTEPGQNPPVKAKGMSSAGKIMLIVFWDAKEPLFLDFVSQNNTVTSEYYAQLLLRLKQAVRSKRWGMFGKGVKLLHDNAPSHFTHCPGQNP